MCREMVGKMELHLTHDVNFRNGRRTWRGEGLRGQDRFAAECDICLVSRKENGKGAVQ